MASETKANNMYMLKEVTVASYARYLTVSTRKKDIGDSSPESVMWFVLASVQARAYTQRGQVDDQPGIW